MEFAVISRTKNKSKKKKKGKCLNFPQDDLNITV